MNYEEYLDIFQKAQKKADKLKKERKEKMRKGLIGGIITGAVILLTIIMAFICLSRVPAGYVGVVYNMNGGIEDKVLTQGWHITAPTKDVTLYSIGIEQSYLTSEAKGDSQKDESFNIPTSDGKTVKVSLEFSYKFDVERVTSTFTLFKGRSGEEIKNTFIKPKIAAWTQEVSANYPVTDIFGSQRTTINAELDTYLKAKFDPYGIIIDTVNFTDISVDSETAAAIQKKVTAQQELELATIEAETAKINAQKEQDVAIMNAERDKKVAEIEAEQIRIRAEVEAAANRLLANSLTDNLIRQQEIEKWNGALPTIMGTDTIIKDSSLLQ